MTLGANSYGSVDEVLALTRLYLQGESTFNTTTRPTLVEVEKFVDRASGVLNLALATAGFTIPVTQADAKMACDQWVVLMAASFVEMSQPTTEYGDEDNRRAEMLAGIQKDAVRFVKDNALGFKSLGAAVTDPAGQGVQYTGQLVHAQRDDPQDSTLEQPKFRRGQFDA